MIEKLRSFAGNQKWVEILFTLMLLSFPFGSFFLSFSVGFMTIYPFLVLVAVLSLLAFFAPRKKITGITRYYLFFVVFLFVYALAFLPFVAGKKDAVIDLRSIALMLMTTWVFISVNGLLGPQKWRQIILFCFKMIFCTVVIFALLEMMLGWHLAGEFTEKIAARGLPDQMMYMPVFLWDNPNNFMLYLILLGTAILILEPRGPGKDYLAMCIFLSLIVFSVVQEARIAQVCILVLILLYASGRLSKTLFSLPKKQAIMYATFAVVAIVYAVSTHEISTGIPPQEQRRIDHIGYQHPAATVASSLVAAVARPLEVKDSSTVIIHPMTGRSSLAERKALFKNGIEFARESYFMGIGPGQYRYRHATGDIAHFAFGNNSAHFWFIELISQYGILIFGMYVVLLGWIFFGAIRNIKKSREFSVGLLMGLVALAAGSLLPSGFLILDINWIFTAILVIAAGEFLQKKETAVND